MNQLEKILEVTGRPDAKAIASVKSQFAETMLQGLPPTRQKDLTALMKDAPPEAVDMVRKVRRPARTRSLLQTTREPTHARRRPCARPFADVCSCCRSCWTSTPTRA
jgi:hypothetical protein